MTDGIRFTLTAYCGNCGWDFAELDDDDLDALSVDMEHRADVLYQEHVKSGKCS
jgi:hypothetical protein